MVPRSHHHHPLSEELPPLERASGGWGWNPRRRLPAKQEKEDSNDAGSVDKVDKVKLEPASSPCKSAAKVEPSPPKAAKREPKKPKQEKAAKKERGVKQETGVKPERKGTAKTKVAKREAKAKKEEPDDPQSEGMQAVLHCSRVAHCFCPEPPPVWFFFYVLHRAVPNASQPHPGDVH